MRIGDGAPVTGGEQAAEPDGTGERLRAWLRRPWVRRLIKPTRIGVLLFIIALVVEYLVVPELVGASKDLYLLGRISAYWVAAGVLLEGLALFMYAVLTKVLLPPGP
jgi:hypothetical protein